MPNEPEFVDKTVIIFRDIVDLYINHFYTNVYLLS